MQHITNLVLTTNGRGVWSTRKANVTISKLQIVCAGRSGWAELRVYFNTDTWDVNKHGLIYSDPLFMRELRAYFKRKDLPHKDVEYTEQGMQGDNYVSCSVSNVFLYALKLTSAKLYPVELEVDQLPALAELL